MRQPLVLPWVANAATRTCHSDVPRGPLARALRDPIPRVAHRHRAAIVHRMIRVCLRPSAKKKYAKFRADRRLRDAGRLLGTTV
jgi:hypothetical protein